MSKYLVDYFTKKKPAVEKNLILAGLRKCGNCGLWMDKEYIKHNKCNVCKK